MKKKGEREEEPEAKAPKEEVEWKVTLVIMDEKQPPEKFLAKGKETLDLYAAVAKLLNNQEKIKEALLS